MTGSRFERLQQQLDDAIAHEQACYRKAERAEDFCNRAAPAPEVLRWGLRLRSGVVDDRVFSGGADGGSPPPVPAQIALQVRIQQEFRCRSHEVDAVAARLWTEWQRVRGDAERRYGILRLNAACDDATDLVWDAYAALQAHQPETLTELQAILQRAAAMAERTHKEDEARVYSEVAGRLTPFVALSVPA